MNDTSDLILDTLAGAANRIYTYCINEKHFVINWFINAFIYCLCWKCHRSFDPDDPAPAAAKCLRLRDAAGMTFAEDERRCKE